MIRLELDQRAVLAALRLVGEPAKLRKAFTRAAVVTARQARARADRLVAPALGVRVGEMRQVSPMYMKWINDSDLAAGAELGTGRRRGLNLGRFAHRPMFAKGRRAGIWVLGGARFRYAGKYPRAFAFPGTPPRLMERVGGVLRPLETDSPNAVLRDPATLSLLNDYITARFGKEVNRVLWLHTRDAVRRARRRGEID